MKWNGIRRNSLDIGNPNDGLLAVNTRFKVDGELRRRRGLARTSIQRKNAGVTTISGFSAFQSNVMAALTDGDRIQGYQNPYSLWGDNPDYSSTNIGGSVVYDGTKIGSLLKNLGSDIAWPNATPGAIYVSSSPRSLLGSWSGSGSTRLFIESGPSVVPISSTITAEVSSQTFTAGSNMTIVGSGGNLYFVSSDGVNCLIVYTPPIGSNVQTTVPVSSLADNHVYQGHFEPGFATVSIDYSVVATSIGAFINSSSFTTFSVSFGGSAYSAEMKYVSLEYQ